MKKIESKCSVCEIIDDFTEFIMCADDVDEVEELLRDLFEIAEEFGMRKMLQIDIESKIELLEEME